MSAHRLPKILAVWCALTSWACAAASAQGIFPVQNLTFGQMTRGVPLNVLPTDAARRAELDLQVSGLVVLTTTLPTQLTSAAGAGLPVSFSATHGIVRWRKNGNEFVFNPNLPYTFSLPKGQNGALVYIGGTAQPSPTQLPGTYTGTITVTIVNAGL